VNAKTRYSAALPTDRTGRGRDANPLCHPENREFRNKLAAMNCSAVCLMCFQISNVKMRKCDFSDHAFSVFLTGHCLLPTGLLLFRAT
jgi:hypothetical protein